MPLTLSWNIADPKSVCRTFSSIKVYRAPSLSGPFVEISAPQDRPELRPDVSRYTYVDPDGAPTLAYASSYYSTQDRKESSLSKPQLGAGSPALSLVGVSYIKDNYLFGMKMTDRHGNPLPDTIYETGIRTAAAWIERKLGIYLLPRDIVDEQHDFRRDRIRDYGLIHVDHLPIRSVQKLTLTFPGQEVASQVVTSDALRYAQWEGSVQVAPGTRFGTLAGAVAYSAMSSTIFGFNGNPDYYPGALRLSYQAGFGPGELPDDLLDLLAKCAALHPLTIAGDLIGPPGLSSSSISIDGLGQSVGRIANQQGNAYASRINAYSVQLEADLKAIKATYFGVRFRVC
jgi:hypothetical protein